MRVKAWFKNLFVFVPIVFALQLNVLSKAVSTLAAFIAFCLASSAVYVFNDIADADKDALHPVKRRRPVASGKITKARAAVFAVVLVLAGLVLSYFANVFATAAIAVYLFINAAYTLLLKHKPIFDCFCIAAGFVLRVYAGGFACAEPVSEWLFLTVVAMSLFMAFGKRRGEMLKINGNETRSVLLRYDIKFLEAMVYVCAGLAVTFYSLWSMTRGMNMVYTVPLILFIVCKYLLLLHESDSHGDPTTVLYSSKTLLAACGGYGILLVALFYARPTG
jgi:4-hydroxybenzoate polyprenyltransferase